MDYYRPDRHLLSLQVAGAAILFLFALQMIFGSNMDEQGGDTSSQHDLAVFPLAVPSIASPGAIMAVIVANLSGNSSLRRLRSAAGLRHSRGYR